MFSLYVTKDLALKLLGEFRNFSLRLTPAKNIFNQKEMGKGRGNSCHTSNIAAVTLENYYLESQEYQSFLVTVEENWIGCPADHKWKLVVNYLFGTQLCLVAFENGIRCHSFWPTHSINVMVEGKSKRKAGKNPPRKEMEYRGFPDVNRIGRPKAVTSIPMLLGY